MSDTLWEHAKEVFAEAIELPAEQRARFIEESCGQDAELRANIDVLLAAHDEGGSFLASPTMPAGALGSSGVGPGGNGDGVETRQFTLPAEQPGTRIGRYKLLQRIGEGGFGVVYLAEQVEPVRRQVALKIIKPGMDTAQVVARFEAERQALAMMDHPNIAGVLDGGATESGRPYFVMELVRGVPITKYCDEEELDTRARLELMTQVCRAVQHAHTKGIIHRDIKPSNVLITMHDGVPVPKVIDFGIAKAMHQRLTERTLFTEFGQFIGTPAYMSPEQAEMSGLDVDTRSDVYALGVLMYELLTGATPFDDRALREAGLAEIQRIIREQEPPRPSTRLSLMGQELRAVARNRRAAPEVLTRQVRGDLDWIVMKALEKDRRRRYETATGLADDILRHFGDEPVSAGPPAWGYRARKLMRRNRKPIAAALTLVALAAITGAVMVRSSVERRDRMDVQTRLVNVALENNAMLLGKALESPVSRGEFWRDARMAGEHLRQLLQSPDVDDDTRERADAFLADLETDAADREMIERMEDLVIASATHEDAASWIGMEKGFREIYADYGIDLDVLGPVGVVEPMRASRITVHLADGLELWLGTIGHVNMLGVQLMERAEWDRWVKVLFEVDRDPFRTRLRRLLYAAADGVMPKPEQIAALENSPEFNGASPRFHSWLATLYVMTGDYQGTDRIYRRALMLHPSDFMLNSDYACAMVALGRWEEAIRSYHRCLAIRPDNAGAWRALGNAYRQAGELPRALEAIERAIKLQPEHAATYVDLASLQLQLDSPEAAAGACRSALSLNPAEPGAHCELAKALQTAGKQDEAAAAQARCEELKDVPARWRHPEADWLDATGQPPSESVDAVEGSADH